MKPQTMKSFAVTLLTILLAVFGVTGAVMANPAPPVPSGGHPCEYFCGTRRASAGYWDTATVVFSNIDGRKVPPAVPVDPEWCDGTIRYAVYECPDGTVQVQINSMCISNPAGTRTDGLSTLDLAQLFLRFHASDDPLRLFAGAGSVNIEWRMSTCVQKKLCDNYQCIVACSCATKESSGADLPLTVCYQDCCSLSATRTMIVCDGDTTIAISEYSKNRVVLDTIIQCLQPRMTVELGTNGGDQCDILTEGDPETVPFRRTSGLDGCFPHCWLDDIYSRLNDQPKVPQR